MELRTVGKSIPRLDVVEQVTGGMIYGVDFKSEGMIYGKLLKSPLAHAKIINIDTAKAEKLPGVRAICTADDLPNDLSKGNYYDQPSVLAAEKVRYYGEPIVAVAADTEEIAEEALKLIDIEFDELPVILDPLEALKPNACSIHQGSNLVTHWKFEKGDIEKGFEEADEIVEEVMRTQQQEQVHLEPHVVIAKYNKYSQFYDLWVSTQRPFPLAEYTCKVLNISQNKLRIRTTNLGGGFGGKNELSCEPIACILSKKSGKVVKIEYTREEEFLCTTNRHAYIMTYKTGVKKDGTITARYIDILSDSGAYMVCGKLTLQKASMFAAGAYDIPNIKINSRLVSTNKTMSGAVRGFGTPQVYFACETHMDTIARKVGIDPVDLRMKNLIKDGSESVTGQIFKNVNAKKTLQKVVEKSSWFKGKPRQKNFGRGVACIQFTSGAVAVPTPAGAIVKINNDGSVILITGATDVGQGSSTVLAQMVAETFGISIEKVGLLTADTKVAPYDSGTVASRHTYFTGKAVVLAAKDALETLLGVVEKELKVPKEALVVEDGRIFMDGYPKLGISFEEAAFKSYKVYGTPPIGKATSNPYNTPLDKETGQGKPFEIFLYASQVAEVEVDTETGVVNVLKIYAVHDCGTPINPQMAEGQVYGGIHMGLGYALMEEMLWDAEGKPLNPQLTDYLIPTMMDTPEIDCELIVDPEPGGPFGAKGIGEPSLMPTAPAIVNAIYDAVGVRIYDLPVTPEKVLRALIDKKEEAKVGN